MDIPERRKLEVKAKEAIKIAKEGKTSLKIALEDTGLTVREEGEFYAVTLSEVDWTYYVYQDFNAEESWAKQASKNMTDEEEESIKESFSALTQVLNPERLGTFRFGEIPGLKLPFPSSNISFDYLNQNKKIIEKRLGQDFSKKFVQDFDRVVPRISEILNQRNNISPEMQRTVDSLVFKPSSNAAEGIRRKALSNGFEKKEWTDEDVVEEAKELAVLGAAEITAAEQEILEKVTRAEKLQEQTLEAIRETSQSASKDAAAAKRLSKISVHLGRAGLAISVIALILTIISMAS